MPKDFLVRKIFWSIFFFEISSSSVLKKMKKVVNRIVCDACVGAKMTTKKNLARIHFLVQLVRIIDCRRRVGGDGGGDTQLGNQWAITYFEVLLCEFGDLITVTWTLRCYLVHSFVAPCLCLPPALKDDLSC